MRRLLWLNVLTLVFGSTLAQSPCDGGSCYPDIGDLLVGREDRLSATSTCGQYGPQNYCIVSHLKDQEKCFICDAKDQATNHDVANVITTFRERLGTWWQSENGVDKVSIRLDLETSFHFTHLIMTFKTFRPAAMIIERSNDYGETWRVYRYFAYDCSEFYPGLPQFPPREIDEVICDSRYSLIEPSTEGELIYKVLEPSLIPFDDPYSPRIQDLLTITNLRINFTHMHTLGDDLLDNRENIKEKYYYSLYELIVRGNCFCYGHADECRPIDASLERPDLVRREIYQVNGRCVCQHNTRGLNCNECLPFYHDQPWRPADRGQSNECKRCNCNNHADECHFDPAVYAATGGVSGGVCDNCRDNTMGRNCELCKPFFYHHPDRDIRDPNVCEACNCEVAGSINEGICDAITDSRLGMIAGQCRCKQHVEGPRCDRCKPGYYNLQESDDYGCTPCDCDSLGTLDGSNQCDAGTGQCICKRHTTGRRCDQCIAQTWGLSADSNGCRDCDCDVGGAYDDNCNELTGQCSCRPHITSRRCSVAEAGFFVPFMDHYAYEAEDAYGNENTFRYNQKYAPPMMWTGYGFKMVRGNGVIEFTVSGLPVSMDYDFVLRYVPYNEDRIEGVQVSIVRPNAGNIPAGSPCDNTKPGDDNWTASLRGHPIAFENLGSHCLEKEYSYIVRFEFPEGMQGLNVDSLVLVANYSGISMFHGDIAGVRRSREFDELACQDVAMHLPKQAQNEICAGLVFSMNAILHDGALACDCDPQGSISSICDKDGGQCRCKPNVMGRRCDKCVPGTFGLSADGCKPCDCNVDGSIPPDVQYCDTKTGQCTCINGGLAGRQCDRCKAGFYKFPDCLACNCNGHTEYCNQETGMCINCRDYTVGDHCDQCEDGYYGDPRLGSQDQCKPCMCPGGPDSSRQFAETCSETYNPLTRAKQVICDCLEGYAGESCNQCAPGHYGNPHEAGGYCRTCHCNDNVDYSDPNACNAQTGECTACLHDTAGPHCEYCRDYFYGNAFRKDCRLCACDVSGTEPSMCSGGHCHCDMTTGQCPCLPNMTGRQCESCLPNHYRGDQGQGCFPCNCHATNSLGATCNEYTGQCECKDGFGGLTCAFCADGYWGNPDVACYAIGQTPPKTGSAITTQFNPTTNPPDSSSPEHTVSSLLTLLSTMTSWAEVSYTESETSTPPKTGSPVTTQFNPTTNVPDSSSPEHTVSSLLTLLSTMTSWAEVSNTESETLNPTTLSTPSSTPYRDSPSSTKPPTSTEECISRGDRICPNPIKPPPATKPTDPKPDQPTHPVPSTTPLFPSPTLSTQLNPFTTGGDVGESSSHSISLTPVVTKPSDPTPIQPTDYIPSKTLSSPTLTSHTNPSDFTSAGDLEVSSSHATPFTLAECNCDPVGSVSVQCDRTTGYCPCVDGVGGRYCDRCKRGFTGKIPDCEPCGECFDNWDDIISDLKERTERAIKRAESIEETGITGAYEDDFAEIERLLSDIEKKLVDLKKAAQADDTTNMIDDIRDRLTEQERRLDRLEEQMDKIREEEDKLNEWLDYKEVELGDLQEKLEGLKDQKKNISKASPAAAYKQVEDAAERSENAELAAKAATTEPGSLVHQSEEVRAEVDAALEDKLIEFADKRMQVEGELGEKKEEVAELSLADLNADVCGRATEECDDTCGGALCDQGCGGLGCNGAVTNAMDAKDRATKTKEILDQLSADTEELSNRIQATKDNALEAKAAAEDAKMKTDEVEMKVKERNGRIRDLISAIREFLASERAKPEEIEKLANDVLGLQLDASRDKFDQLAKNIQDLVSRLPDVDIILERTQSDLDRANELLENAKEAAAAAAAVAGDTRAVREALDAARNASELADAAKNAANINIDLAQEKINDIASSTAVIANETDDIKTRVEELEETLKRVENGISNNKWDAEQAKAEAAQAKSIAEEARDALIRDQAIIKKATDKLDEKKGKVDRLKNLKNAAEELQQMLNGHLDLLNDLDNQFNDYERKLQEKNNQLESMLALVKRLYADIEAKESNIRLCP